MRTTIDLPDALFARAKSEAALRGMKLKDFVAAGIAKEIASQSTSKPSGQKRPIPVSITGVDWSFPHRNNADLMDAAEKDI